MNENILCESIASLRRQRGMTQEQLAGALGVTYQAVSKWENSQSCPDVMLLPDIAAVFGVSIDALFGREAAALVPAERSEADEERAYQSTLPWPDDETLYAVLFKGHTPLTDEPLAYTGERERIRFVYSGPALNVTSHFNITCENCEIAGGVNAAGNVKCETVGGDVSAGGDVNCAGVGSGVYAGGDVDCAGVGGDVSAGGDVDCGGVEGNVSAGGDVDCGSVGGSVSAGGDVDWADGNIRFDGKNGDGESGDHRLYADFNLDLNFSEMNRKLRDLGNEISRTVTQAVNEAFGKDKNP